MTNFKVQIQLLNNLFVIYLRKLNIWIWLDCILKPLDSTSLLIVSDITLLLSLSNSLKNILSDIKLSLSDSLKNVLLLFECGYALPHKQYQ